MIVPRFPSRVLVLVLFAGLLLPPAAAAQTGGPFTIEDYFKVVSARVEDWTRDGRALALSLSALGDRIAQDNERSGDPTYVPPSVADLIILDTATAKQTRVFPGKAQYRSAAWSPDGSKLAVLAFEKSAFGLRIWDRATGRFLKTAFGSPKPIASNSPLIWTGDGKKIYLHLRTQEWETKGREAFQNVTRTPIMIFDSEKPFLPWDEVSRRSRLVIPALWDAATGAVTELLPETAVTSARLTEDGTLLLFERDVTEKTSYDAIGGTKNQLEALPLAGGEPRILLKPYEQRSLTWSRDKRTFAYADKGDIFIMGVEDKEPRQLTGEKEPAVTSRTLKRPKTGKRRNQSFSLVRFSPDGSSLLCTSTRPQPDEDKDKPARPANPPRQYWLVDVRDGNVRTMLFELPEKEEARPSLQLVDWSPDGKAIYFSTSAPDRYDRGLQRFDVAAKAMSDLVRSAHLYGGWRMAEDGSAFIYRESDGDRPDDLFLAAADFSRPRKILETNPRLAGTAVSHTELISYRDADGKKAYGVLVLSRPVREGEGLSPGHRSL